jgi:hypothetical protein
MGGRLFEDGFAWSQRLEARGLRSRFQWIRTEKRAALSRAEISPEGSTGREPGDHALAKPHRGRRHRAAKAEQGKDLTGHCSRRRDETKLLWFE